MTELQKNRCLQLLHAADAELIKAREPMLSAKLWMVIAELEEVKGERVRCVPLSL